MSGGRFNYMDGTVQNEIFGYAGDRTFENSAYARRTNPFEDRQVSELCWDMFCLIHSLDWYLSGDSGADDYQKDLAYFKKKWLKAGGHELARREVDMSIGELRNELYRMLGFAPD